MDARPIVDRIRDIVTGAHGVLYPITRGYFTPCPSDRTLDTLELEAIERAFTVTLSPSFEYLTPLDTNRGNTQRAFALVVRVGYAITTTGGGVDWVQGGADTAAADEFSVSCRSVNDAVLLTAALTQWRNTGGVTPHIMAVMPDAAPVLAVDSGAARATLTLSFRVWVHHTTGSP